MSLHSTVLLVLLGLTIVSGCGIMEVGVRNPVPGLHKVAVAPFFNLSQDPSADGREYALAYFTELQKVPGFEVLPVGVAERALQENGLSMAGPEDALELARILNVDAVVVGAITDHDSYTPRVGLKIAWYSPHQWLVLPNEPPDRKLDGPSLHLGQVLDRGPGLNSRTRISTQPLVLRGQSPDESLAGDDEWIGLASSDKTDPDHATSDDSQQPEFLPPLIRSGSNDVAGPAFSHETPLAASASAVGTDPSLSQPASAARGSAQSDGVSGWETVAAYVDPPESPPLPIPANRDSSAAPEIQTAVPPTNAQPAITADPGASPAGNGSSPVAGQDAAEAVPPDPLAVPTAAPQGSATPESSTPAPLTVPADSTPDEVQPGSVEPPGNVEAPALREPVQAPPALAAPECDPPLDAGRTDDLRNLMSAPAEQYPPASGSMLLRKNLAGLDAVESGLSKAGTAEDRPALVYDEQVVLAPNEFDPREPLMDYARMFDSTDRRLVSRLSDYLELSGETRSGDLEAHMKRSDFFRRFASYVMINEMLMLHGGETSRRLVLRPRKFR